ncbi:MAG: ABC transporter ATP-binding protein [Geminicoccaceae bacterium]
MSSDRAIRIRGVSKSYKLFASPMDRLLDSLWSKRRANVERFTALKSIDLDVAPGETVGLVGANGSGKSTLLQLICGILQPDEGEVRTVGKIAALLELGTSFNPNFTGRENVEINGLLMGFDKARLADKMDDILAFADIGEFIDQPVSTYSSGMFARLAFAVAIHVDPDILVIDEALAVGDEAFQRKCYARLEKIKAQGATILFVSHSAGAILELCDRAVLLYRGERLLTSEPKDVITHYQKLIYSTADNHPKILQLIRDLDQGKSPDVSVVEAASAEEPAAVLKAKDQDAFDPNLVSQSIESYPSRGCEISNIRILDRAGRQLNNLTSGRSYIYQYDVAFSQDAANVRFSMLIKTTTGVELGAQWSAPRDEGLDEVRAGTVLRVRFPFSLPLNDGTYFGNAGVQGIVDGDNIVMHRVMDATMFRIQPTGRKRSDRYVSILAEAPIIEAIKKNAEDQPPYQASA